jgi:outer membrane protein with beta-barrel domain
MRAMVWIGVVSATCLFIPESASGQDSRRLAVAGGYSLVRDNDIDETLNGWVASGTGHVALSFGITAEAGGTTKALPVLGTTLTYRSLSFMAGPNFSMRPSGRVTLFGQVLFGGMRGTVGILDQTRSRTDFALQPGGGADFWMSRTIGIRVGADYRRITAAESVMTQLRFHVGMVIGG